MKPRKVKHLDPDGLLADNVARIVSVRLDELCGFMPQAADPQEVTALHDLRIAAKRLRYVLELFAPSFGPYAATAAKKARKLQDLVGEIHDCDVTLPRVEALLAELRERDAAEVRQLAGDATDLDAALAAGAPHAASFRGLESLDIYLRARRDLLFERFLEQWHELERQGFRTRLEFALAERSSDPEDFTSRSHDGNGAVPTDDLASDAPA
ncbi:MAG TPA: CHAD domain-containing protein [Baekduia sp.]|uniref:CHAD domain-containing protein n=1 Tax=Baekduia sp. TaxID=2600305 RepID=UPI002B806241|nr:CHAD domain-containing protein [Baekduia sp.]HMJ33650.1 CHAD domain-containing protein [Baekduia sp.]